MSAMITEGWKKRRTYRTHKDMTFRAALRITYLVIVAVAIPSFRNEFHPVLFQLNEKPRVPVVPKVKVQKLRLFHHLWADNAKGASMRKPGKAAAVLIL
jgi:hypothetical protein